MERKDIMPLLFREETVCPYFCDTRTAVIEYLIPSEEDAGNFHLFLAKGYRRLDTVFYRNLCTGCSACVPIRLSAGDFVPSRSQQRTLKENRDVEVVTLPMPAITAEKVHLYERYLRTKHGENDGSYAQDPEQVLRMLHHGFAHTVEMDYYAGGKLIGVGIVDEGKDALSSNYFYYDTDCLERRPGIFSILQEIYLAQRLKKHYYYLGFYIEDNRKMCYKKQFRPNRMLRNGKWK
jgi:leucyl-tRNA---protein transferase